MRPLTPAITERLVFIRHLYRQALQAANEPRPLKASAILSCHDATELLLGLISEAVGRTLSPKTTFAQYFELLKNGTPPIALPYESTMLRLNTARVGLKHHGLVPDDVTVSELVIATGAFLSDSVRLEWNVALESVSLITLIKNDQVRTLLQEAQRLLAAGQQNKQQVSEAFGHVVKDMMQRLSGDSYWTVFLRPPLAAPIPDDVTRDYLNGLHNQQQHFLRALVVVALQVDYKQYVSFALNSYPAGFDASGAVRVSHIPIGDIGADVSRANIDFVIECALKAQGSP